MIDIRPIRNNKKTKKGKISMKKLYVVLSAICLISATVVIAEEIEIPGWSAAGTSSSYSTGSSTSSAVSASSAATSSSESTAVSSTGTNSIKATSSKTASTASASAETADSDGITPSEVIKNVETQTTSVHKSVKNVYDSVNMIKGIRF